MYSVYTALVLAILCMDAAVFVNAGLYIVQPAQGSTCRGGEPCTITWLDDGTYPLLSAIGVSTVGLYTGKQRLVQTITPIDVTAAHSMTFTPNAAAGPNSDSYYIAITSTTLKGNDSVRYSGWSPYFSLVGMSGSFDSPLPAATSPIPIPASLTRTSSTGSVTPTITVGTLFTSQIASSTTSPSVITSSSSSSSRLTTLTSPSATSTSLSISPTPTPPSSNTSGAIRGTSDFPLSLSLLALAILSSSLALFS